MDIPLVACSGQSAVVLGSSWRGILELSWKPGAHVKTLLNPTGSSHDGCNECFAVFVFLGGAPVATLIEYLNLFAIEDGGEGKNKWFYENK